MQNINDDNFHFPKTSLVCVENTVNKGGGSIWSLEKMQAIRNVCDEKKLPLHLDGARLFNALVETQISTLQIGNLFDSISICLSKGLGCPIGSLLIGDKNFINKARRIRKVMGGGMRQAGFLAAAGIFALDNNIERLKDDHRRAKQLQSVLTTLSFVEELIPAQTNLLIFKLKKEFSTHKFIQHFAEKNITIISAGVQTIRFAFHLDVDDNDFQRVAEALQTFA